MSQSIVFGVFYLLVFGKIFGVISESSSQCFPALDLILLKPFITFDVTNGSFAAEVQV